MSQKDTAATVPVEPSTTTFSFVLAGQIDLSSGVPWLICSDDTRLRLSANPTPGQTTQTQWQVIPNTNSTGEITTVRLLESPVTDTDLIDVCQLVGEVIQLSTRTQTILLKVALPNSKPLSITISGQDDRIQQNQRWSMGCRRIGNRLVLETARPMDEAAKARTPLRQTPNALLQRREKQLTAAQDKALNALIVETGSEAWELGEPTVRRYGWEWEAISKDGQRARVQVDSDTENPVVYQYPQLTPEPGSETQTDSECLTVRPLGAARGIGASCFQVLIGPYEVVLDCGTRPKGYDPLPALDYLKNPDLLLISHAHQDHIGAVPIFHSRFPGVRMICTPGTREIAHIMLTDCLKVQQQNEDSSALFDETDLERTLFRLETEPIGTDFEPLPGLTVRFINAGHIVGAACIYLRYGNRSLFYTGDYNTTSSHTTEGLKLSDLPSAEMLITESTYGADLHPARKTQETALLEAILSVVSAGGNVLIPAFALGRAQEILLAIRTNALFKKLKTPVYVDGLVRAVTDTFRDNLELLPLGVQNFAKQEEPFFCEEGTPPIIPIRSPRERPLAIARPSVVIASSGMLSGGASVWYARTLLERENAAIFISGYTDEESPGRKLQQLNTGDTIELEGKELTVRAAVKRFNLSAHADKIGLTQVINRVNPRHLILIHGSINALHELFQSGELSKKYLVHIPEVGEEIRLGNAPEHMNTSHKTQLENTITKRQLRVQVKGDSLQLSHAILSDPRWLVLSGSGTLQATWDDDGLGLRLRIPD